MRKIQDIPISKIKIINPRERDPSKFEENVNSIRDVGLKRPVVLNTRYLDKTGMYELVCGQGRIEAVRQLGELTIPALMVDVDRPTALIMSIAENAARQTPAPIWFAKMVKGLYENGMSATDIGEVIGKSDEAVYGYLALIKWGEEILLNAVEQGRVSATVAIEMARSSTPENQRLLLKGYEQGEFNPRELKTVRKLLDLRNRFGKVRMPFTKEVRIVNQIKTLDDLREEIKRTLTKQEEFVQKSQRAENRLVMLADGFRRLRDDPVWDTLIKNEELTDFPKLNGNLLASLFETNKQDSR